MHHVFVEKQGYTLCLIFNTFMKTSNSSILLLLLFLYYFSNELLVKFVPMKKWNWPDACIEWF